MTADIIDGKTFALNLREKLAQQVAEFTAETGIKPGLAVVLVGDDPASQVYVGSKGKACEAANMTSMIDRLPADTSQQSLLLKIAELNQNPDVHGILVQLPLPSHIDEQAIIESILPSKDVDGFHPINVGKLSLGDPTALIPCTPQGCLMLLQDYLGNLTGKHAVIIGRSNIVGKPMAMLLTSASCTVTICHSQTQELADHVRRADIVVAAVGRPEFVPGDWIKPGAVVIDVGINRIEIAPNKTKLVGDVNYAQASQHAAAITPVPGGVGPMTIACLLKNTLQAARQSRA